MPRKDLERGQALVLLAAAFIGVAAFVGLTIDAGILFSNVGHLRRATDAAALAAANQFREGRTPLELSNMAFEYLELNGLSPSGVVTQICDLSSPGSLYDDPSLCPGGTNPPTGSDIPRKYVQVEANLPVNFAFLPIIGFHSTIIRANSISEAASVDLVLAIDVSTSMAEGDRDLCVAETLITPPEDRLANPDTCHPFEEVRDAAHRLVDRMYFPYDRISIVTFGRQASVWLELTDTEPLPAVCNPYAGPTKEKDCAHDVLDEIQVEPAPVSGDGICDTEPTPRGCMSTNIGDGLLNSGGRFCIDDGPPVGDA
ncbi:MAG: VWA domain-containing protein, partial [Planctomycetes bacterium]|nr:VWA domain-containing protein [Planctomycetota bacterium]